MKFFSTYSARMTVVRKDGYYMSTVQAQRVVKKLAVVLELNSEQIVKAELMLSHGFDETLTPERCAGFTPAELKVISDLSCWYSHEYHEARSNPCFIALNLNRGYSLVISEGRAKVQPASLQKIWLDNQYAF